MQNFEKGRKYANTSVECEDHIKGYTFRKLNCPYTSCSEDILFKDVEDHLRNLHLENDVSHDDSEVNIPRMMKTPFKTRAKFVLAESDLSDDEYYSGPSEQGVDGEQLPSQIVAGIDPHTCLL